MRTRRQLSASLIPLVAGLAVCAGLALIWQYRSMMQESQLQRDRLAHALDIGDLPRARATLPGLKSPVDRLVYENLIRTQELSRAVATRDVEYVQQALDQPATQRLSRALREQAALCLARHAIKGGDEKSYRDLRLRWLEDSNDPAQWFLLEADHRLESGDAAGARKLLESRILAGRAESLRVEKLTRLEETERSSPLRSIDGAFTADRER